MQNGVDIYREKGKIVKLVFWVEGKNENELIEGWNKLEEEYPSLREVDIEADDTSNQSLLPIDIDTENREVWVNLVREVEKKSNMRNGGE